MKQIFPLLVAGVLVAAGLSMISSAEEIKNQSQNAKTKIITYYFHGTYRCPSCKTIEEWSHETIKNNFQDEWQRSGEACERSRPC